MILSSLFFLKHLFTSLVLCISSYLTPNVWTEIPTSKSINRYIEITEFSLAINTRALVSPALPSWCLKRMQHDGIWQVLTYLLAEAGLLSNNVPGSRWVLIELSQCHGGFFSFCKRLTSKCHMTQWLWMMRHRQNVSMSNRKGFYPNPQFYAVTFLAAVTKSFTKAT